MQTFNRSLRIEDAQWKEDINVYPNPTKNHLKVLLSKNIVPCTIELIDDSGRVIKTMKTSEVSLNLNTSEYLSGVYIFKVQISKCKYN